jgi:hypothetical protein
MSCTTKRKRVKSLSVLSAWSSSDWRIFLDWRRDQTRVRMLTRVTTMEMIPNHLVRTLSY